MTKKQVTRRDFLKTGAVIGAGTIIAPTIIPSCVKGANDRIMVAHIGVGGMGSGSLKSWYMPLEEVRNVATCDPFEKKRVGSAMFVNHQYKEKGIAAPKCESYLDMMDIFKRKDIDAVNINTPDHWHVPAAIMAARAGKHVMLAKPLGLSYPQYEILEDEVRKNKVKFHYGTQQRASKHVMMAIDAVKDGVIGNLERAEAWCAMGAAGGSPVCNEEPIPADFDYDRWIGPAPMKPYCAEGVTNKAVWYNYDYAIGFLAGWGAHPLDLLVWGAKDLMTGKYTCEGTGSIGDPDVLFNTVYSWDLNYEYESGFQLRFMSTDVVNKKGVVKYRKQFEGNSTTFFGSKGWISVGRGTAETNIPELQAKFDAIPKKENGHFKSDNYKIGQDFVDVIKGRIEEKNPLDEAIMSDCISHMGDVSLRTGRKVTWDPKAGEVVGDAEANALFVREYREPYTI